MSRRDPDTALKARFIDYFVQNKNWAFVGPKFRELKEYTSNEDSRRWLDELIKDMQAASDVDSRISPDRVVELLKLSADIAREVFEDATESEVSKQNRLNSAEQVREWFHWTPRDCADETCTALSDRIQQQVEDAFKQLYVTVSRRDPAEVFLGRQPTVQNPVVRIASTTPRVEMSTPMEDDGVPPAVPLSITSIRGTQRPPRVEESTTTPPVIIDLTSDMDAAREDWQNIDTKNDTFTDVVWKSKFGVGADRDAAALLEKEGGMINEQLSTVPQLLHALGTGYDIKPSLQPLPLVLKKAILEDEVMTSVADIPGAILIRIQDRVARAQNRLRIWDRSGKPFAEQVLRILNNFHDAIGKVPEKNKGLSNLLLVSVGFDRASVDSGYPQLIEKTLFVPGSKQFFQMLWTTDDHDSGFEPMVYLRTAKNGKTPLYSKKFKEQLRKQLHELNPRVSLAQALKTLCGVKNDIEFDILRAALVSRTQLNSGAAAVVRLVASGFFKATDLTGAEINLQQARQLIKIQGDTLLFDTDASLEVDFEQRKRPNDAAESADGKHTCIVEGVSHAGANPGAFGRVKQVFTKSGEPKYVCAKTATPGKNTKFDGKKQGLEIRDTVEAKQVLQAMAGLQKWQTDHKDEDADDTTFSRTKGVFNPELAERVRLAEEAALWTMANKADFLAVLNADVLEPQILEIPRTQSVTKLNDLRKELRNIGAILVNAPLDLIQSVVNDSAVTTSVRLTMFFAFTLANNVSNPKFASVLALVPPAPDQTSVAAKLVSKLQESKGQVETLKEAKKARRARATGARSGPGAGMGSAQPTSARMDTSQPSTSVGLLSAADDYSFTLSRLMADIESINSRLLQQNAEFESLRAERQKPGNGRDRERELDAMLASKQAESVPLQAKLLADVNTLQDQIGFADTIYLGLDAKQSKTVADNTALEQLGIAITGARAIVDKYKSSPKQLGGAVRRQRKSTQIPKNFLRFV